MIRYDTIANDRDRLFISGKPNKRPDTAVTPLQVIVRREILWVTYNTSTRRNITYINTSLSTSPCFYCLLSTPPTGASCDGRHPFISSGPRRTITYMNTPVDKLCARARPLMPSLKVAPALAIAPALAVASPSVQLAVAALLSVQHPRLVSVVAAHTPSRRPSDRRTSHLFPRTTNYLEPHKWTHTPWVASNTHRPSWADNHVDNCPAPNWTHTPWVASNTHRPSLACNQVDKWPHTHSWDQMNMSIISLPPNNSQTLSKPLDKSPHSSRHFVSTDMHSWTTMGTTHGCMG